MRQLGSHIRSSWRLRCWTWPNSRSHVMATVTLLSVITVGSATALSFDSFPNAFIETTGTNSLGRPEGDRLAISILGVDPGFTTLVTATQGSTSVELKPLMSNFSAGVLSSDEHWVYVNPGVATTGSWQIRLSDMSNPAGATATVSTNAIGAGSALALPASLQVDDSTGSLTPTIKWQNPTVYDRVQVRVIDTRTNLRVVQTSVSGDSEEFAIPSGVLAPDGQYTFRIAGVDSEYRADAGREVAVARANAYVDYVAASTERESGDVGVIASGPVDTAATIGIGLNSHPGTSIRIGNSAPGAVTIDTASSLIGSFVNVGHANVGSLLIDGGSVELYGTDGFPDPNGGLLTVGRHNAGTGFASITNGGSLVLNAAEFSSTDAFDTPGVNIGRDAGSKGTVVVDNASTITINGWDAATTRAEHGLIGVGRSGVGRLDIRGGSMVTNDAQGLTLVGARMPGTPASGRGVINVDGAGSTLNAGEELRIGDSSGAGGDGFVSVRNGGSVVADFVNIYRGGLLSGDGLVTGDVSVMVGGVVSPGNSPGTLTIDGDLILDGGSLFFEAFSASEIDKIVVNGNAIFGAGTIELLVGFDPTDLLDLFDITGTTTILETFGGIRATAVVGSGAPVGETILIDLAGNENSGPLIYSAEVRSAVPLPATILFVGTGLLLVAAQRISVRIGRAQTT